MDGREIHNFCKAYLINKKSFSTKMNCKNIFSFFSCCKSDEKDPNEKSFVVEKKQELIRKHSRKLSRSQHDYTYDSSISARNY